MLNRTLCSVCIWACLMLATFQAHAWMDGWRDCGDCCYYDNNCCDCDSNCDCWDMALFRLYGGYSVGRDVGVDSSYATLGATWFPELGCDRSWIPFVDVAGHWLSNNNRHGNSNHGRNGHSNLSNNSRHSHSDHGNNNRHGHNDGRWAANAGIGVRYLDPCTCDSIWGLNVYYDYRGGRCKRNYNQVGVGLEWLHPCWDVRVNGYFPVGDQNSHCRRNVFTYPGGAIITCQELQTALTGFDAEIGAPLWCNSCYGLSLYGAVGPYYYTPRNNGHNHNHNDHSGSHNNSVSNHNNHHNFNKNIWGGRIRLAARWNDWVELSVQGTRDNHFKTRVLGTITVMIPFEALCSPCQCEWNCYRWWDQPVHRQPIIGVENKTCFNSNF